MRENQQRKLTMQKIAKGGPQLSGVKKPAPATPSAGRRINPKAAKPKPAAKPAKPSGPARPSVGNLFGGPGGRGRPASAQADGHPPLPKPAFRTSRASARAGQWTVWNPKPRTSCT
jgi:hypothetical protein